jgi:hypothetical protein
MEKKFPLCYKYFKEVQQELEKRDNGKKISPFYSWGRTQGIAKKGYKIITPTFSREPRFLWLNNSEAYFTNGYGLYFKNNIQQSNSYTLFDGNKTIAEIENVNSILKILNSFVMQYYISCTSVSIEGGYPCYQKNFIEKFTIPDFSINELNLLNSLTEKKKIDAFLASKYEITI